MNLGGGMVSPLRYREIQYIQECGCRVLVSRREENVEDSVFEKLDHGWGVGWVEEEKEEEIEFSFTAICIYRHFSYDYI